MSLSWLQCLFLDLSTLEVVHQSNRTEMDSEDSVYSPNIRNLFLGLSTIF